MLKKQQVPKKSTHGYTIKKKVDKENYSRYKEKMHCWFDDFILEAEKADYRFGLSFGKCCGYAENRIISEIISDEGIIEKGRLHTC